MPDTCGLGDQRSTRQSHGENPLAGCPELVIKFSQPYIYFLVIILIIRMTIVSVPEYVRNNTQSTLGEPLIWDSDTKTGICTGLKFNALSDGSSLINDSHANYHDDWTTPTSYSLISIFRSVAFIRINFKVFDKSRGCKIIRGYYMKSNTLKLFGG
jgi:hypothetical protein